ncbi:MAG: hypothetical protein PUJ79_01195 [Helicobacter sp.]|uniref:hypothetical protein n=1 Tax=Helicobacter sp. 10-6591 TaxID=2004998 RepID=UPI000DCDD911|nr:hypothetical protein [Helicobacter sp. 10-6591]MCI7484779.1 hypothetical protein [Helicobacter sp.]MDD7567012.1 hypothetical protein [Helicobacter sp.]MDY5741213.1 hypothetical protein [Helicobacter sp.]RAX56270.1 hypothetical protein CCY97_00225 [Helicobacter sp. 10-6591]
MQTLDIELIINTHYVYLKNGFEISEWEMDGIKIKRRSPLELIDELEKIKDLTCKSSLPVSV